MHSADVWRQGSDLVIYLQGNSAQQGVGSDVNSLPLRRTQTQSLQVDAGVEMGPLK